MEGGGGSTTAKMRGERKLCCTRYPFGDETIGPTLNEVIAMLAARHACHIAGGEGFKCSRERGGHVTTTKKNAGNASTVKKAGQGAPQASRPCVVVTDDGRHFRLSLFAELL